MKNSVICNWININYSAKIDVNVWSKCVEAEDNERARTIFKILLKSLLMAKANCTAAHFVTHTHTNTFSKNYYDEMALTLVLTNYTRRQQLFRFNSELSIKWMFFYRFVNCELFYWIIIIKITNARNANIFLTTVLTRTEYYMYYYFFQTA